jgi:hypothetical protein
MIFATVLVLAVVIVWFDSRLLRDLARTPDRELRHFNRGIWALIIVLTFPIGPMLYLRYAKLPF